MEPHDISWARRRGQQPRRRCALAIITMAVILKPAGAGAWPVEKKGRFGAGPGAWPVQGAIYEVCPENFPNHSLNEITARIPVMKKLGVSVIYLTPIFQHAGAAQYLILDYYKIDPRYGTAADLRRMVAVAHEHGMKILLDFVTSLTTDGSYFMTQHPEWILRGKDGAMQRYYPFPEWGWALDCANPGLIDYYTRLARYYVEKFDTDGWRLDSPMNNYDPAKVEGDHSRMEMFRAVKTALLAVKKDSLLLAEIAGPEVMWNKDDSRAETLFDEMAEASYNYDFCGFLGGDKKSGFGYFMFYGSPRLVPLQRTMLDKIVHNRAASKEVVEALTAQKVLYGRLRANFIENHDTERVSKAFPRQHRALFVLAAAMPGVPVIHAGQEIGSTVHPSVSGGNPVVDWKRGDPHLEAFYRQVMKVRADNKALWQGAIEDVWKKGDKVIAFLRRAGDNRVVVALNFDARPARFTIGIPPANLNLDAAGSYRLRDQLTGEEATYQKGQLESVSLHLPPYGYRILEITGE